MSSNSNKTKESKTFYFREHNVTDFFFNFTKELMITLTMYVKQLAVPKLTQPKN